MRRPYPAGTTLLWVEPQGATNTAGAFFFASHFQVERDLGAKTKGRGPWSLWSGLHSPGRVPTDVRPG